MRAFASLCSFIHATEEIKDDVVSARAAVVATGLWYAIPLEDLVRQLTVLGDI